MASTGSGLPIQRRDPVLAQPGGTPPTINAAALSTAEDWTAIAAAGSKLQDVAARAVHQADVAYLADQSVEIARTRAEMRDQFADNPAGFDAAWEGYTDGKLAEAEPRAVPHIKRVLGTEGNAAFSAITSERRAKDERLHAQSVGALADLTGNDVVGAAMAGTLGSPDGQVKVAKYRAVLDSAVTSGLMPKEKADLLFDDKMSAAQGEIAARDGVEVYREKGFAAAEQHLRATILENESMTLKGESKYKAFGRGLQAIKLAQAGDKEDRVAVVEMSKDLQARVVSNQPYDPGEVRDALAQLQHTGAAAEFKRLSVAVATAEATAPFRNGQNLREFAGAVSNQRVAVNAPAAPAALDFFTSKGWTRQQAAGIVGNLLQESAKLDPTESHDQGTGIGVAGWRLERRAALKTFAAGRGTTETDFQTQLEFLDHELRTTEGAAGAKLRNAKTAAEAAEAFIHFERPQGYTSDNPRAGHGYSNRVRNAQALVGESSDGAPAPYAGEVTKRVQAVFVDQAKKAWPDFKARIDQGKVLDTEDFQAVRYAAALSGDANWQKQVEDLAVANGIGKLASTQPIGTQPAIVDEARRELGATVAESLEKQFTRQNKMAREDPVSFQVERGRAAPPPLDLSTAVTAKAGVAHLVQIAQAVAEEQQIAPGNPFRPAELSAIAGAITTGKPQQAAIALDAIASLPDDMLTPALGNETIKQAVSGAVRSGDGTRFNSAMQFMDRLWARGPETTKALFGEDAVHELMTWRSNLRYMTPEQLAKERDKKTLDPGVREQFKTLTTAGKTEAAKMKFEDVVGTFDESYSTTPGPLARALGSQPRAPVDGLTRAALMADHEAVYARRYAETFGDKDKAAEQTLAILKTKWHRSEVNGGRLMLNAPETVRDRNGNPAYPAVDGSHDWITKQIEADLTKRFGLRGPAFSDAQRKGEAPIPTPLQPNWDYTLVSDRRTENEAAAGQRASYLVVVTDNKTGQQSVVPSRYAFDPTEAVTKGRADFDAQRARQSGAFQSISGDMKGMFDPTIGGKAYAIP